MNVEYVNPFIEASQSVFQMVLGESAQLGKVLLKDGAYDSETVAIIVGVTGQMRGQVVFSMSIVSAKNIASTMMGGMAVNDLDELSKSALSELTNMILGNTATILAAKGIGIEITPPSMLIGESMKISPNKMKTISVPMNFSSDKQIFLDISVVD